MYNFDEDIPLLSYFRLFMFGLFCFSLFPIFIYDQMPTSAIVFSIIVQFLCGGCAIYYSLWRRTVSIDLERNILIVCVGPFMPFIQKKYDIKEFTNIRIERKIDAIDEDGYNCRIIRNLIISGKIDVKLVAYSHAMRDKDQEKEIILKISKIKDFIVKRYPEISVLA